MASYIRYITRFPSQMTTKDWAFARRNGCGEPNILRSKVYTFGFDNTLKYMRAYRENRSCEFAESLHQELGNTFRLPSAKGNGLQTCDPKNVQALLATQFHDFDLGGRKKAYRPLLGQGIFASDGKTWEHSRALLRPNFVRNQIADIEVFEKHVLQLLRHIPRDGSTVDLQEIFLHMTVDLATEFLFGESINTLESDTLDTMNEFTKNFKISLAGMLIRTLLGSLRVFHGIRNDKFNNAISETRNYVRKIVKRALEQRELRLAGKAEKSENPAQNYVFLYELANQVQDEDIIIDQLLSMLIAGRDTTAILLSMTFITLSRREDVWNKLRAEVLALEGRKPSFEDLKSMKYLTWVMNETLRLYPVVPLNIRTATKNTTLPRGGGPNGDLPIFVAKGSDIQWSTYAMHRLPEIYGEDAAKFRPERWEDLRPGLAYIPFHAGPRTCIGQQFALTEAGYTIVRLLQEFESIESRDPEPILKRVGLTLSSANGAKVALTPVKA
ncbi:n-alkane-inducible cytochrome P450 [Penicillium malachiteum]|nr:n-alkane-inducible cytochrome P450 [Penicillium malachiteum]